MSTGLFCGPELVELLSTYFFVLIKHQLYSGQSNECSTGRVLQVLPNMTCFKQLGHFELLRDRMLYHFCKMPQQQQAPGEMSEDDGNLNLLFFKLN